MTDSHRCIQIASQAFLAALLSVVAGCGGDVGTPIGSTRFGQVGEVRVEVQVPLIVVRGTDLQLEGELVQTLTWNSTGPWQVYEAVSYRGRIGDESLRRSQGTPNAYSSAYASLITQINDTPELNVFVADNTLEVDCLADGIESRSRVTVQIRDEMTDETRRWSRCAEGSLEELTPEGAGPDPEASRIVQAAILARQFSAGQDFHSVYLGTLPYGTLERGENSGAEPENPLVFRVGTGVNAQANPQAEFSAFWNLHSPGTSAPAVNWSDEMVLVGAIGEVAEAGDSVEVRRVIQDLSGTTRIELIERVPGDFCSPAARRQFPYHIVVAPLVESVVVFTNPAIERVSCGL
jgi:hypothetical protein